MKKTFRDRLKGLIPKGKDEITDTSIPGGKSEIFLSKPAIQKDSQLKGEPVKTTPRQPVKNTTIPTDSHTTGRLVKKEDILQDDDFLEDDLPEIDDEPDDHTAGKSQIKSEKITISQTTIQKDKELVSANPGKVDVQESSEKTSLMSISGVLIDSHIKTKKYTGKSKKWVKRTYRIDPDLYLKLERMAYHTNQDKQEILNRALELLFQKVKPELLNPTPEEKQLKPEEWF